MIAIYRVPRANYPAEREYTAQIAVLMVPREQNGLCAVTLFEGFSRRVGDGQMSIGTIILIILIIALLGGFSGIGGGPFYGTGYYGGGGLGLVVVILLILLLLGKL